MRALAAAETGRRATGATGERARERQAPWPTLATWTTSTTTPCRASPSRPTRTATSRTPKVGRQGRDEVREGKAGLTDFLCVSVSVTLVLFVQHHWSWDEFLFAGSQRLEMVPTASRVFNADGNMTPGSITVGLRVLRLTFFLLALAGAEIDDIMCIEENDMLFFSTGRSFKTPSSGNEDAQSSTDDKMATVVGGYKVTTLLGRGGFGEVENWSI